MKINTRRKPNNITPQWRKLDYRYIVIFIILLLEINSNIYCNLLRISNTSSKYKNSGKIKKLFLKYREKEFSKNNLNPEYVYNISNFKSDPFSGTNNNLNKRGSSTDFRNSMNTSINNYSSNTGNSNSNSDRSNKTYQYSNLYYNNTGVSGGLSSQKGESSNYHPYSSLSTTTGSTLNPIINNEDDILKARKPRYVEKLGSYDTDVPSQRNLEALSLTNQSNSNYYVPFHTRLLMPNRMIKRKIITNNIDTIKDTVLPMNPIYQSNMKENYLGQVMKLIPPNYSANCSSIGSPSVCQSIGLCVWDKFLGICVGTGI